LGRGADERGEISNLCDLVVWKEQLAHSIEVEPFVWRSMNGTVVEVESVAVDESPHPERPGKR
jgi:hypothetical protein